jgi:Flp pilus assembly protein protease CpaA
MDPRDILLPIVAGGLWACCAIQDLRTRRVPLLVLLGLATAALLGRPWPWWVLAAAALLWPWRAQAWILAPLAAAVGLRTADTAAALALGAGAGAWSLGWWGGADAIVLLTLALRHGATGLMAGATAALCGGVLVMLLRRQSLRSLLAVVPAFLRRRAVSCDVPAKNETPAAAAMALGGLIMEGLVLCQMLG